MVTYLFPTIKTMVSTSYSAVRKLREIHTIRTDQHISHTLFKFSPIASIHKMFIVISYIDLLLCEVYVNIQTRITLCEPVR